MNRLLQYLFQFLSQLWRRLLSLLRRRRYEREMEEEMRFHLEMQIEQNLASGMATEEARYAARRQFGNQTWLKEVSREMWGLNSIETLIQDLRYGVRTLMKSPGFTFVAVLTLALGIGANTAIFSVVNSILLRPLPYQASEQLVQINHNYPKLNLQASVSPPGFAYYRQISQSFAEMYALTGWEANLTGQGDPERLRGARVSASFFPTLGISVTQGRDFTTEDGQPGRNRVVIISDGLWLRRFGGAPDLVNKALTINGENYIVVGIAPRGFQFGREFGEAFEVWTPLAFAPEHLDPRLWRQEFLNVFARLKPHITVQQAQAEMETIAANVRRQYLQGSEANDPASWDLLVRPLMELVVGDVRRPLLILLASVGLVLLISCANVANLLLARAAARQKEMSIRAALGARRRRIISLLLVESLLLATLGGGFGLLLAYGGVKLLTRVEQVDIPRLYEVGMDWRVLGFTALVSLASGAIFGLVPAWQAARIDLNELLKESGRSGLARGSYLRSALVVVEMALALMMLIGAGLLIRSFQRVQQVNPGFRPEGLLVMQIALPRTRYRTPAQADAFYQQLLDQFRSLPGVQSAGAASILPLSGVHAPSSGFEIEGHTFAPGQAPPNGDRSAVTADYFRTMNIPLVRGRYFSDSDQADAPPVAIIDETMARKYWPDESSIGKRISFQRDPQGNPVWREIVGLVGHVKQRNVESESRIQYYVPHRQLSAGGMFLVIRTAYKPASLAPAARNAIRQADAELPVFRVTTMEQLVANSMAQRRFASSLLSLFAGVALLLAATGLYGVVAYMAAQRTHEIGVRLALGARASDVLRLVIGEGMKLAFIGALLGLGGALALTRWLKTLLFGMSSTDPLTFIVIVAVLMIVALLACWIPARRAASMDPLRSLRVE